MKNKKIFIYLIPIILFFGSYFQINAALPLYFVINDTLKECSYYSPSDKTELINDWHNYEGDSNCESLGYTFNSNARVSSTILKVQIMNYIFIVLFILLIYLLYKIIFKKDKYIFFTLLIIISAFDLLILYLLTLPLVLRLL